MGVGPAANIKAPLVLEPKHSLLKVARIVTDENGVDPTADARDGRWEAGFQFLRESCEEPSGFDPCSTGVNRSKQTLGAPGTFVQYQPWEVIVPFSCTAAGFPRDGYEESLKLRMEVGLSKALEREFWTGELIPANPHLLGAEAVFLNEGPEADPIEVSPKLALAMLGQGLADCGFGALGVIHAPPLLVELWTGLGLLHEDDDGHLRTKARGDFVIVGSGYPADEDSPFLAFATGLLDVRLGKATILPENFTEAFDRATNTVTFRMERTAAVTHGGCCTLGIYVQRPAADGNDEAPVIACDEVEPTAYSYPVCAEWVQPGVIGPSGFLTIGVDPSSITPVPAGALSVDLGLLTLDAPLGGPPGEEDIPARLDPRWISSPNGTDPFVAIPLDPDINPVAGQPGWVRLDIAEDGGCTTTAYAYIPDVPVTQVATDIWVKVQDGPFHYVGLTAADDSTACFDVVDETGDCPEPTRGLAVVPACGTMPVSAPAPLDVNIVSGGGGVASEVSINNDLAHPVPVVAADSHELGVEVTRLTTASTHTTAAGRRSVSVTVISAAGALLPTIAGVPVPAGYSMSVSVDFPGDTLDSIVIEADNGDDVIVVESF